MATKSTATSLLAGILGAGGGGSSGSLRLPTRAQLEAAGLTDNFLLDKFASHTIQVPVSPLTGTNLSQADAFIATIDALPQRVRDAVKEYIGLNNPQLGATGGKPSTISQRVNAILPTLAAFKGNIGAVNVSEVLSMQAQTAQLVQIDQSQQANIEAARTGATLSQEYNAESAVDNYLQQWGLNNKAVSQYVAELATNPKGAMTAPSEILNVLRGNSSNLGPVADKQIHEAYQNAFPGLTAYNASPNAVRMTEAQYLDYTRSIMNSSTQYGVPAPSQKQIGELLNHNVSPAEYQQRVQDIGAAVENANPNVKAILQQQYGINQTDLVQYLTTGTVPGKAGKSLGLPQMQREIASADIQDYTKRVGLEGVSGAGFNQLADMAKLAGTVGNQGLGYGISQIQNSLLGASRDVALTKALPGASNPTVNTNTLIASQLAGFGGTNQIAAQTEVARAEQAKAAPFEKGGGYAESAKGVIGLGAART